MSWRTSLICTISFLDYWNFMLQQDGEGLGKVSCFSEWLCSFVLSFIKIIVVSSKTQCDLEVYVLCVLLKEQQMEIGSAWVRVPQNGECPGAAQVDGYLPFHLNAHGATELVLKKKEKDTVIPNVSPLLPVLLKGSPCLTVHLPCGLQISPCACSSVPIPPQYCLVCAVTVWLPTAGKFPGAMPTLWVKP